MKYLIPLVFAASAVTLQAREIRFKDCPAAVKKAINARLGSGKIDDIDLVKVKGQPQYIVEIDRRVGSDIVFRFSKKGKELLRTEDISYRQAPATIRKAIDRELKAGWRIDDIDRVVKNKVTTFVVEIDRNNAPDIKLTLASNGKVLKTQVDRYDD